MGTDQTKHYVNYILIPNKCLKFANQVTNVARKDAVHVYSFPQT